MPTSERSLGATRPGRAHGAAQDNRERCDRRPPPRPRPRAPCPPSPASGARQVLVAELGHGGGDGAGAEVAAVAVGCEPSSFGDGFGFRARGEPTADDSAADAADELGRADIHGLAGACAVRGLAGHGSSYSCGRAPGRISGAGAFCGVTRSIRLWRRMPGRAPGGRRRRGGRRPPSRGARGRCGGVSPSRWCRGSRRLGRR